VPFSPFATYLLVVLLVLLVVSVAANITLARLLVAESRSKAYWWQEAQEARQSLAMRDHAQVAEVRNDIVARMNLAVELAGDFYEQLQDVLAGFPPEDDEEESEATSESESSISSISTTMSSSMPLT
jgi:hypothetical protein